MPSAIPPDIVALCDYQRHAQARLPAPVRAYIDGAGADGLTAAANLAAWADIRLEGRVLADLRGATTALHLLGLDLPHPILLAPVAFHALAHPEAEHATALGAAATGAVMVVSTQSGLPLEDIAARAQGPLWFQLYLQPAREDSLRLIRRAEAAGFRALVVTVDTPINGLRNMEQRAGFQLPEGLRAVNLDGCRPPEIRTEPGRSAAFLGLLDTAPRWPDIDWLRQQTRLPILLKGITSPRDAAQAVQAGADGLIVSNHGGRALDGLPASAHILPRITAKVAGRIPVLCDGGIRRGTDIVKALALGASAVLIGRPQLHALAVAGAGGVAHMLTILRAELEVAMALTGCPDLTAIDHQVLWPDR